ncbi:helix-turn-helix transcriptional regulator [Arthrobacter rhizosphaerae]|uniref:helix-turn-helix transcriptional regulator n=1 Tax=Arthrobacter rhizosphaerae TaxID=2855490 RepID=UPI001FF4C23C|nr:LuxR family transcriptional regulator [Arthrobacter rhizosphaerae]
MNRQLTGRRETMERVCHTILTKTSQAVFLISGPGIGKSALVEAISERLTRDMNVLRIHGSSSLAKVPFGVLAPYTSGLSAEDALSPVAVLRSVWTYFQKLRSAKDGPLLLVVDDAHHLDDATASIVVDMVSAGWASVLATGRSRPGLPAAMNQLWYDGLADRIDLRPLTQEQVAEAVGHALEGTVPESTVQALWTESGGNPLLLDCLLNDAIESGSLVKRNGIWLLLGNWPSGGRKLTDVVAKQLQRRSAEEQEALKLIALSEPVPRGLIEEVCGARAVRSLLEHQLVRESMGGTAELRLLYPSYSGAIRRMVSASRSLHLRRQLLEHARHHSTTAEGVLRMVSWSLECGAEVPDAELLEASVMAARLFQNSLALDAAARIRDPDLRQRGQVAMARAHYNQGSYEEAAKQLDLHFAADGEPARNPGDVLLWACTHAALGHIPEAFLEDARRLLDINGHAAKTGELSDASGGEMRHWTVLELFALSAAADYRSLGKYLDEFDSIPPGEDPNRGSPARGAFMLAMRSEVLRSEGRSEAAENVAAEANALLTAEGSELFFFPEFVLHRQLGAAMASGHWIAVEDYLAAYTSQRSQALVTFGGTVQSWRGISFLLRDMLDAAGSYLLPAVESLRENDPLGLLPMTLAAASYTTARTGDTAKARRLLQDFDYLESPGRGFDAEYARIFSAASIDVLQAGDGSPGTLLALLDDPSVVSSPGAELLIHAVAARLGHRGDFSRIASLTENMEGTWAGAWHKFATAHLSGTAADYLEAGEAVHAAGLVRVARNLFAAAADRFGIAGNRLRSREAASRRDDCDRELRVTVDIGAASESSSGVHLTRREKDIVVLAVEGLTDRQIADKLMVSVRTVEGHLYRSYAKLGIRGRDQLASAVHL